MSKAVLVVDMPKKCCECDFCSINEICLANNGNYSAVDSRKDRPCWCPLKELPEKQEVNFENPKRCINLLAAYGEGWNTCLDAITGGAEDE